MKQSGRPGDREICHRLLTESIRRPRRHDAIPSDMESFGTNLLEERAFNEMATLATARLCFCFELCSESESKSMLCEGPPGGRVENRYKYSYPLITGSPDARMHMYSAHTPRTTSLCPLWHLDQAGPSSSILARCCHQNHHPVASGACGAVTTHGGSFPLYLYFGYFFTTSTEGLATHLTKTTAPQLSLDNREPPQAEIEPLWIHDPE